MLASSDRPCPPLVRSSLDNGKTWESTTIARLTDDNTTMELSHHPDNATPAKAII